MAIKSLIKILIPVIICLNYNSPKLLEAREPQAFSAEEMASIFPDEWSDGWVEMVIGMTGFVKGRNREFSKGSASVTLYKGIGEKTGSFDYFLMLHVKDGINKEKVWQEINKMMKQCTGYKSITYSGNKGFLVEEKGSVNLIYGNGRFIIIAILCGQKGMPSRVIKFIEPVLQSLNLKKITKVKVEKEKSEVVYPGMPLGIESSLAQELTLYQTDLKVSTPFTYNQPNDFLGRWEGKINGMLIIYAVDPNTGNFFKFGVENYSTTIKFNVSDEILKNIPGEAITKIISKKFISGDPEVTIIVNPDKYPLIHESKVKVDLSIKGELTIRFLRPYLRLITYVSREGSLDTPLPFPFHGENELRIAKYNAIKKGDAITVSLSYWRIHDWVINGKSLKHNVAEGKDNGVIRQVTESIHEEVKNFDTNGDGRLDSWEYLVDLSPDKAEKGYDLDNDDDFSPRIHPITKKPSKHKGIDIQANIGDTIRAAGDGYVYKIDTIGKDARGKRIVITHDDGYKSEYWHLTSLTVQEGDRIKAGQPIGTVGETGSTTGPHLHYGVKNPKGEWIDPVNDYFH